MNKQESASDVQPLDISTVVAGQKVSASEWHATKTQWEANDKLAEMNGVAATYEVWLLEQNGNFRIIAVDGPSGGCGRHPGYDVVAVGSEGEYPRILADVVAKITQECKENWG